jgi:hypothetical protein
MRATLVQLLRDRQQLEAIQFYHDRVGGSLGEAKAAIEAIESGLRDASAPLPPGVGCLQTISHVPGSRFIGSRQQVRRHPGVSRCHGGSLREASTAIDGMERQLHPRRAQPTTVQTNTHWAAARGWVAMAGLIIGLIICSFAGCGAFMQTQAIYRCSMREIKAVLVRQEIFQPPVDGGYIVIAPGFTWSGGSNGWRLEAEYFTPVWGANDFGIAYSHVRAEDDGWNSVSAGLYTRRGRQELFPAHTLDCRE